MRLNNFRVSGSIHTGLFPVDVPRGRGDNAGTIFTAPAPKNLWRPKIVQNFSQFLATFHFDGEYLLKGSAYQKSEKLLIIYTHPTLDKKSSYTSVHKRESYWLY